MSLHSNSDTTLGRVENPSQYTLKRRPWRLRSTSFSAILEHPYSRGDGSAESPFIIEWLPQDHENPQTFSMVYKVCVERQERKVWREGGDNAVVSPGSRRPRTLPPGLCGSFAGQLRRHETPTGGQGLTIDILLFIVVRHDVGRHRHAGRRPGFQCLQWSSQVGHHGVWGLPRGGAMPDRLHARVVPADHVLSYHVRFSR